MHTSHTHLSSPPRPGYIKQFFFWLSGAGADTLEQCPGWEQRKYVAFGATVLVPTVFAFIACSYALSTITDNWKVIFGVSAVWGLIIMTIDRALLSIYRSYQKFHRKLGQFFLRIVVAGLMGVTISHPLTLLIFSDTISSVIEEERSHEIGEVRTSALAEKSAVETKIKEIETQIAEQRSLFDQTFSAQFLVADDSVGEPDPLGELSAEDREAMQARITTDTQDRVQKIASLEASFEENQAKYTNLQTELDHWQQEFEREVNGQRSGIIGLGPRARSINDDQLAWRRDEAKRLSDALAHITTQRNEEAARVKEIEEVIQEEFLQAASAKADRLKEERERVASLRRQVQQSQAEQFVDQQNGIRATITAQIDTRLAEVGRLQGELANIAQVETRRIESIEAEPRRDILTQTLALHHLFEEDNEGGQFALISYVILVALFMLVDTIPLVVKFFSQPGPYDSLVDREEVRFAKERESWKKSYQAYMDELSAGKLLHLTQDKPMERALIHGVDSSRAAREFMENLLDLEASFEARIEEEKTRIADDKNHRSKLRTKRLEQFAEAFYQDLDKRMESFFGDEAVRRAASRAS